jgi:hypothetical protein
MDPIGPPNITVLGTWNVRSLYKAGSLITVSKELSEYR